MARVSVVAEQFGPREAVATLEGYLSGALTLDELIDWAERLAVPGCGDAWLQKVAADLSNPLLCREQATALVQDHLRSRARQ